MKPSAFHFSARDFYKVAWRIARIKAKFSPRPYDDTVALSLMAGRGQILRFRALQADAHHQLASRNRQDRCYVSREDRMFLKQQCGFSVFSSDVTRLSFRHLDAVSRRVRLWE